MSATGIGLDLDGVSQGFKFSENNANFAFDSMFSQQIYAGVSGE